MRNLRRQLRLWDFRFPTPPALIWTPVLLLVVAHWLRGLPASYAIDETGSYYMSSDGPWQAMSRAFHWRVQSPLYHAILALFLGPLDSPYREMVSRLPSLAGLVGATWMIYRIAHRWIAPGAAVPATLLFAAVPGVAAIGIQARPYGLLWLAATLYLWTFWSWIESERPRDLWLSRALLALCISLHYLSGLLMFVELVNVLWQRRLTVRYLLATAAAVGLATLPLAPGLLGALTAASKWLRYGDIAPHNYWNLDGELPFRLTLGLALMWAVARLLWPRFSRPVHSTPALRLFLLSWLVLVPTVLGVLHLWSETFHTRYLLLAAPAGALLAGDALAHLAPSVRLAVWTLPLLSVLLSGRLLAPGGAQDFRGGAEKVMELSLYEVSPLLVPSWFVEAGGADAASLYRDMPGLYGHLAAYPVPNAIHPLPVWYSPEFVPALGRLLDGPLKEQKRVLIAVVPWLNTFHEAVRARGWRVVVHRVHPNLAVVECLRESAP